MGLLWRSAFCSSSGHSASHENGNCACHRHPFSTAWAAAPTSICKASPGCCFHPRRESKSRGFAPRVSWTRLFPHSTFLGTVWAKTQGSQLRHPAEPSNSGCGICCSKGGEGIPDSSQVFAEPQEGGGCIQALVDCSCTSLHPVPAEVSLPLLWASVWEEAGLGNEQGGRGQGCREGDAQRDAQTPQDTALALG